MEQYTVKDEFGNVVLITTDWEEAEEKLAQSPKFVYFTEEIPA